MNAKEAKQKSAEMLPSSIETEYEFILSCIADRCDNAHTQLGIRIRHSEVIDRLHHDGFELIRSEDQIKNAKIQLGSGNAYIISWE